MKADTQTKGYKASKHKKTTFGIGLLKGLGITLRHLVSPAVTMEYPDEKDVLPPRSRGVIALKTENCTVCMLCARECPDWCIYIEGHKEAREPSAAGKRAKKYNVLDRFAIDYALCMYCGICVEVCPYDALFWSPEFDYSETDIVELTHEQERLNEWMYSVLPPPPLDEGAQGPELKAAPAPPAAAAHAPPEASRKEGGPVPVVEDAGPDGQAPSSTPAPSPQAEAPAEPIAEPEPAYDPDLVYKAVLNEELGRSTEKKAAEARARTAAARVKEEAWIAAIAGGATFPKPSKGPAPSGPAEPQAEPVEGPVTSVAPSEETTGTEPPEPAEAPSAGASAQQAAEIRRKVKEEELGKGSDPRVAEARAKAAEMRAIKGTKGPGG